MRLGLDYAAELVDCLEFERHLGAINTLDVAAEQVVILDGLEFLLECLLRRLPFVKVEDPTVSGKQLLDSLEVRLVAFDSRVDVDAPWNFYFDVEHAAFIVLDPCSHHSRVQRLLLQADDVPVRPEDHLVHVAHEMPDASRVLLCLLVHSH